MFSRDRWLEIFETIRKNKLRTFLSGFTVALGILIFVVLFGFGNGLRNTFENFFEDDAKNTMWLRSGRTSKPYMGYEANRLIEFDNDDLKEISSRFEFYIEGITPRISFSGNVGYKLESNNYSIRGVGPSHQKNEMTIMMKGRYINGLDIDNKERNVVIGRLVEQDLFKGEDGIGKFISGGGRSWKVVGVFQDDGGDNEERIIYAPYTTIQLIQKSTDKVGQIIISYKPEIGYGGAVAFENQLRKYIKQRKNIAPTDPRGVFIRSAASELKENDQFASVLQYIISFVGIGTLLAGIIGISNIMVFVVKERTKELGIRKAIGATPKSIIGMILQEAIFITTISGYIGLFIGIALLNFIGDKLEEQYFITDPFIDLSTGILATVILIAFGAFAGYLPAQRAARIKPIEALRDS
ncbi:MAG: FtsX-like permease family protein [Flavobacteriaceae bacterium]|jgi:putative ABC transport system permease protein|nr:FtsX-like permease family protein [Flavobacteriaceae bacterium]MBT3753844.1 FtsX-like permease family protein [Flavobacteriaceae bacterium]MBT3794574.1 FtsX-like permease family protein [Flavobacteriaceae bacterium]MBT4246134.1 FtsX-like permease family protein [Flavobacteriaceae bacterium]MBT4416066.1 FtsX-like permease family protein [Flavobacteriaceae bacterium]